MFIQSQVELMWPNMEEWQDRCREPGCPLGISQMIRLDLTSRDVWGFSFHTAHIFYFWRLKKEKKATAAEQRRLSLTPLGLFSPHLTGSRRVYRMH